MGRWCFAGGSFSRLYAFSSFEQEKGFDVLRHEDMHIRIYSLEGYNGQLSSD